MTSNITSFIAPALPVQIPVAYSPTDELLMMIGATLGGAPSGDTFVLVGSGADLVLDGGGNNVIYS
jgi:hypothetical protein